MARFFLLEIDTKYVTGLTRQVLLPVIGSPIF